MTAKKATAKKTAAKSPAKKAGPVKISGAQRAGGPSWPSQPGVPPPENA